MFLSRVVCMRRKNTKLDAKKGIPREPRYVAYFLAVPNRPQDIQLALVTYHTVSAFKVGTYTTQDARVV
jgi:hypothetical protein